ncbi:MAG: hypothetical protein KDD82_15990 [Planctomycetes bacterium]|nr:hypothetical protein [Planctomycetota bacterium]
MNARRVELLTAMSALWVTALAGCSSEPAPPPPPPVVEPMEAPTDLAQPSPEVASLLPVDPQQVLWYVATRPGAPPQRVALFSAFDPQVQGRVLRSLGWSRNGGEVRLWPGSRAIWFWPQGLAQTAYRVWAPARSWDDGRGQRHGQDVVEVPAGRLPAVRTERRGGALRVQHWLSPGLGLVRLEVSRGERSLLLLELCAVSTRALTRDPPASSPEEAWTSVQAAVEHLDAQALEALVAPEVLQRLDGPEGAVGSLLGRSDGFPRLRAYLELSLARRPGDPALEGAALARLPAASRAGPVTLEFRAEAGRWRWTALQPWPAVR